jgi:hypothetical protein
MQEGRRIFQAFAARMFEQRVLTAYGEKVAHELQRNYCANSTKRRARLLRRRLEWRGY